MAIFLQPYQKYAQFSGRATRSEYWGFYLFQMLVGGALVLLMLVGGGFSILAGAGTPHSQSLAAPAGGIVFLFAALVFVIFIFASLIPSYAVAARRLHDRGMTGWLQLLMFVPVGNLVLLVLLALPGNEGDNQHGADPKAVE